jgi:hypothetical protein
MGIKIAARRRGLTGSRKLVAGSPVIGEGRAKPFRGRAAEGQIQAVAVMVLVGQDRVERSGKMIGNDGATIGGNLEVSVVTDAQIEMRISRQGVNGAHL